MSLAHWIEAARVVVGMNRRNVLGILPRNQRRDFPVADDKLLAKRILREAGVPVAPTLATFSHFGEIRELGARIGHLPEFVVKPAQGSGGRGILVIAEQAGERLRTAGNRWLTRDQLRKHVADIVYGVYSLDRGDVAVVEPRLRPSPFFASLFPQGLTDVRVIVVDHEPVLAMLRVPTLASDGRANLHQGALGLAVDVSTGAITRAWWRRRVVEAHPDSGAPLLDLRVPGWATICDVAVRAGRAVPLRYLGVDVVVDDAWGPLVLEINARPGLEIQNVNGIGLRARLDALGIAI